MVEPVVVAVVAAMAECIAMARFAMMLRFGAMAELTAMAKQALLFNFNILKQLSPQPS